MRKIDLHLDITLPIITGIIMVFALTLLYLVQGPQNLEYKTVIIEDGSTVKSVASLLEAEDVIKSEEFFTLLAVLSKKDGAIKSGEYAFKRPESVLEILRRVTVGDYGLRSLNVVLHEGLTIAQMSEILDDKLINFDEENFAFITLGREGYLFPDTYTFLENATEETVLRTLEENFARKTQALQRLAEERGQDFDDIVTMASIIEKEASATSKQQVSNILWKRIEIDMPLQVDAPFVYERDKNSFTLSIDDLREDSEYNTYTRPGLTPTPIGNPGLASLNAAANPEPTEYLFFLTGRDGLMYYAATHDQHVVNKNLYLR